MSDCGPFCPTSFTSKCSLQRVAGVAQGLCCLVHHHHQVLTASPLGFPTAAPSSRDPVGIIPQDQSF